MRISVYKTAGENKAVKPNRRGTTGKSKIRLSREEKVKSIKKLSGTRGLVHSLHSLILVLQKKKSCHK